MKGSQSENFGDRFCDAFEAIAEISAAAHIDAPSQPKLTARYEDVDFVYPVHMNPNVRTQAHAILANRPNVQLIEPFSERPEVIDAGVATLVAMDKATMIEQASAFLDNAAKRNAVTKLPNPFGDRKTAARIVKFL